MCTKNRTVFRKKIVVLRQNLRRSTSSKQNSRTVQFAETRFQMRCKTSKDERICANMWHLFAFKFLVHKESPQNRSVRDLYSVFFIFLENIWKSASFDKFLKKTKILASLGGGAMYHFVADRSSAMVCKPIWAASSYVSVKTC